MAAANGSGGKGFEVPKVEVRFTKLFINGQFVDAVSGTPIAHHPCLSLSLPAPELSALPAWSPSERTVMSPLGSPLLTEFGGRAGEEPSRFNPNDDAVL